MKRRVAFIFLFFSLSLSAQNVIKDSILLIKRGTTIEISVDSVILDKFIMEDSSTLILRDTNWSLFAKESFIGINCLIIGTRNDGKNGYDGMPGENANGDCQDGKGGGIGKDGMDGMDGANIFISTSFKKLGNLTILSNGSNGGNGGKGGNGGRGGKADISRDCRGGNGGRGGDGGDAGKGGNGGNITIFYMNNGILPNFNLYELKDEVTEVKKENEDNMHLILVNSSAGNNGKIGTGGAGGSGGSPVSKNYFPVKISKGGGATGERGRDGIFPDYPSNGITEFGIVQVKNENLSLEEIPNNLLNELKIENKPKYHALIIYNEEYEKADPLTVLPFQNYGPKKVATKIKDILSEYYYFNGGIEFYSDLGELEMYARIRDKIETMKEDDNLFIFYTGHGYYDTLYERTYWIPIDGGKPPSHESWFDVRDLIDYLGRCKAKSVLIVTDACFGGGLFYEGSLDPFNEMPTDIKELFRRKSRIAFTSGNLETVPKKSVFSKYFIEYLEENGKKRKEKFLPSYKIFNDIRPLILNNIDPDEKTGKRPIPCIGTIRRTDDDKGDFILILKEKN